MAENSEGEGVTDSPKKGAYLFLLALLIFCLSFCNIQGQLCLPPHPVLKP